MKTKNKKKIYKKGINIPVGRIYDDGGNSTTSNELILPAGYAHGEYRPTDAEGNARFTEGTELRAGAVRSDEFGSYMLPDIEVVATRVVANNEGPVSEGPVIDKTTLSTEVPAVESVQPVGLTPEAETPKVETPATVTPVEETPAVDNNKTPTKEPTDETTPKAAAGKTSNFNLGNTINGIMGMVNSGIQAYNNVSPVKSADTSSALQLGNSNYQMGSLQNLANQYANRNVPLSITGNDLYNPSAGERFGQMFQSGLSGFQAGYSASANSGLTSNMGEFSFKKANGGPLHKYAFGGGAMIDAAVGLGMAGVNMGLNAGKNAANRKQAALDALRFNALKEFSVDRNNLDFQRVLNDSTDNMFNMAALQMKANGGTLFSNGGEWSTGLNVIGNGGTHEQNPFEGVPMGIAPDGIPNLVEENETVWTDDEENSYVFSERLKVSKKMLDKHMLPSKYEGKSYAEVSKELAKEAEERPNDPISKRGLNDNMSKLRLAQEEYKAMRDKQKLERTLSKLTPEEQNILIQSMELAPQQIGQNMPTLNAFGFGGYSRKFGGLDIPGMDVAIGIIRKIKHDLEITRNTTDPETDLLELETFESELDRSKDLAIKEIYAKEYSKKRKQQEDLIAGHSIKGMRSNPHPHKAEKTKTPKEENTVNLESLEALPANLMKYTPTLIQGIQALKGNKVDYTNPNLIAANTKNINFTPLGDYMALERLPFASTIGNQMQAQQAATNAAIQNVAANRAAAIPSLITSGYKGQTALADAALEAAKYNNLLTQTESEFNRGTNQANLTAGLLTAMANQQIALDSAYKQAAMREAIDLYISASDSANVSNFMESLLNIGRETLDRKALQELIASGIFGAMSDKQKTALSRGNAYGGKLKRNKRKGLTC